MTVMCYLSFMHATEVVTQATENTLEQVNTDRALAGAWLLTLHNRNSRQAYRRDLEGFAEWLQALADTESHSAPELLEVTRPLIDLYANSLLEQGRKASTVARKLSALSSFYTYAQSCGAIDSSPLALVKRPKVSEDSPTLGPDRAELRQLLEAAKTLGQKEYALISLLGLLGLRVSEVTAATVEDLGEETGRLGGLHYTLTVTRKGGKRQQLALEAQAVEALAPLVAGRTQGALLLRESGLPLDRYDCSRIVSRVAKAAGLDKRLSPHSLRHGYVTLCLEAGAPLHEVQDSAGHKDPRTTQRYNRGRQNLDRSPTYALAAYLEAV